MTAATSPTMTLEEFLRRDDLPEEAELVLGRVVLPTPEGPDHYFLVRLLTRALSAALANRDVDKEAPVSILGEGQPRADVVVYRKSFEERLAASTLDAKDVEIVIEVSVTTAAYDLGDKEEQYARAGIPEYVVFDVRRGTAIVHTDPTALGYARRAFLTAADEYRGVPLAPFLG